LLSITDEDEFRNLVVWLEDQKIRWYKIEDRGELRDIKSSEWLKAFAKVVCYYLKNDTFSNIMGRFLSAIDKDKLQVAQNIFQLFPRRTF